MQGTNFEEVSKFNLKNQLKLQLPAETTTHNKIEKIHKSSMSFEKEIYNVEVQEPTFVQNVFIQSVSLKKTKCFFYEFANFDT